MLGSDPILDAWPELPLSAWQEACTTLHLWTQVVGKIRLAKTPWLNHSWHATLYLSPRGLTTSPIAEGNRQFQIDFDFIDHRLLVSSSDGRSASFRLSPMTMADATYHSKHQSSRDRAAATRLARRSSPRVLMVAQP